MDDIDPIAFAGRFAMRPSDNRAMLAALEMAKRQDDLLAKASNFAMAEIRAKLPKPKGRPVPIELPHMELFERALKAVNRPRQTSVTERHQKPQNALHRLSGHMDRLVPPTPAALDRWLQTPVNRMRVHEWLAADIRRQKVKPRAMDMIRHVMSYGLSAGDAGDLVERFLVRLMHQRSMSLNSGCRR